MPLTAIEQASPLLEKVNFVSKSSFLGGPIGKPNLIGGVVKAEKVCVELGQPSSDDVSAAKRVALSAHVGTIGRRIICRTWHLTSSGRLRLSIGDSVRSGWTVSSYPGGRLPRHYHNPGS